jgi:hypothetical protein
VMLRQLLVGRQPGTPDAQQADVPGTDALHPLLGRLDRGQDPLRVPQERLTGGCQLDPSRRPVEPACDSSCRIACESGDWAMCSRSAACPKCRVWATVMK